MPRRLNIVVLSRADSVHSTRRLVEAAELLGHEIAVVDPVSLQLQLGPGEASLWCDGHPLPHADAVLPRFALSVNSHGLAALMQYELRGAVALNGPDAIACVRDKVRLLQRLCRAGLPVPPTVVGRGAGELRRMVDRVGGFPAAVRVVTGPGAGRAIFCESATSMEAAVEAVLSMGHELMVQRSVEPGRGRLLRALVVGGRVEAAVRWGGAGEAAPLRSAGAMQPVRLTSAQAQLACDAAAAAGLQVAAVELLQPAREPPMVFDLHASPGLRELEAATGEDLALPIVRELVRLVARRDGGAVGVAAEDGAVDG